MASDKENLSHGQRTGIDPADMRMNLRQLEAFKAVVDAGSIRAAARVLQLTQPAVTHTVRELERGIGAELLQRSVRGVEPTALGLALYRRAHLLVNELRRAREEMAQLRDGTGGRVSIALSSAAAAQLLPPALTAFRALRPGVELELQEISWPAMDTRWQGGDYDFAVISELDEDARDGLEREVLFAMPMVLAVRTGHPMARTRSVLRLSDQTWLLPGYGHEALRRVFAALGHAAPRDIIFCHSAAIALEIVRQVDAVGMVSSMLFRNEIASRNLVALPLRDKLPQARVSIVVRDVHSVTPAARLLMECLRRAASRTGTTR